MVLKLRNNFKKGDRLPISVVNNSIILHSITSENTLDITEMLDKQDVINIRHIGKAIAVVKDRDNINICYYFQYHVHSQFSILDGMSKLNDIAKKSSGITALTDHGNMFAILKWQNAMQKEGKYPVFGTEAYVEDYLTGKKNGSHLILIAKNEVGKKNLFLLSSNSFYNFYRKPHVSIEDLKLYSEGIICTSACLGGEIATLLAENKYDDAKKVAIFYKETFGDDFYLEIQKHDISVERKVNADIFKLGLELGIKVVAANDSHYIDKEDVKFHETLLCVNQGKKINEDHFSFDGTGYHYMTDSEMVNQFWDHPEVISNTLEMAEKCNLVIETGVYHMPSFEIPEDFENDVDFLHHLITEGFKDRYYGKPEFTDETFISRLNYEENVIVSMGFSSYFLIVQDYIMWAKRNGILVGPGRGSAAGSLVAYCLKITDLDPIKHGLLFERFLNPERISMPDIDVDFADDRRQEVINYCKQKYGTDKVCNIITFGHMMSKMVVQDVARTFDATDLGNQVKKLIPKTASNLIQALEESPELQTLNAGDKSANTLLSISQKLEGNPRNTSIHACGIVISDTQIKNYLPTAMVKDSNSSDEDAKVLATQVTMAEVEELGLLKMDFLGLKTMTVIGESLTDINTLRTKEGKSEISYYREIPINDPYVYSEISEGKSFAVFQIESEGMREFMSQLFSDVSSKVKAIENKYGFKGFWDNITGNGSSKEKALYKAEMEAFGDELFERMVAGISLYRPGPMDYIPDYINNMGDPEHIVYDVPSLEPILKPTYGIIVYQEQVMQIVRELASFSMGAADTVRKAMGKKKQEILDEYKPYFIYGSGDKVDEHTNQPLNIKGCVNNGVPENIASGIWDKMSDFAKYAFNKSHAAVYAVLTVTCAWMKHYYPSIYMKAMFNVYIDGAKLNGYINVAKNMGIKILPPDVNHSFEKFTIEDSGIRFGFKGIKGLSKSVSAIVKEREFGVFTGLPDFVERTYSLGFKKSATEALTVTGAFDSFPCTRRAKVFALDSLYDSQKKDKSKNIQGQISLFDNLLSDYERVVIKNVPEYPKAELLLKEKEISGMYISEHPLDQYSDFLQSNSISEIALLLEDEEVIEKKVTIAAIVDDIKIVYTKKDHRPMAILKMEDRGGTIPCVVFADDYSSSAHLLEKNKILVIKGTLQDSDFGVQILTNSISDINDFGVDTVKKIFLKLDNDSEILKAEKILGDYIGDTPVFAQIDKTLHKLNINAKPSSATFMALQNEYGSQNVKFV